MRRLLALTLVLALLVAPVTAAHAGGTAGKVALGLAAFAVFTQLVGHHLAAAHAADRVVIYAAPAGYGPPQVLYAGPHITVVQPAPTVIHYPHGRYELRGDGVTVAYHWVWIPAVPPPPPPPPPAAPSPDR